MGFFRSEQLHAVRTFLQEGATRHASKHLNPVTIVYNGDGDGCCAAYFFSRWLEVPVDLYWVAAPEFDFAKLDRILTRIPPRLNVFLDMPVHNRPKMIHRLATQGDVFIYDHHVPDAVFKSDENDHLLYANPIADNYGHAYPTSLFGWELFDDRGRLSREILYMGLAAEACSRAVPLFEDFDLTCRRHLKETVQHIQTSFLVGEVSDTHHALDFLSDLQGPCLPTQAALKELRSYQILQNIHSMLHNEKRWLRRDLTYQLKKLRRPKLILKSIHSKARLCGLMASDLRWEYPDLIVGIWQHWKARYHCELRRGGRCRYDLANLIKALKGEVPLIASVGHPSTARFTAQGKSFFKALDFIRNYVS